MQPLSPLQTSDQSTCQFLFSDSLRDFWDELFVHQAYGILKDIPDTGCFMAVDSRVWELYKEVLKESLEGYRVRFFVIPSGERSKSIACWKEMIDAAFSEALRRNTPLIAVGGGVAGDLSGFVAASLMRGLPFIQVPTTLLAMVDSAIGGKTGINHPFGKNTIGAFYHPRAVFFHMGFLNTLPEREWLCGLSEVLKYGYIRERHLLDKATQLADSKKREPGLLREVIQTSVSIKADVVEKDSKEASIRAFLNFGHTFAHALEAADGFKHINHGEAVYAGMIAALYVSEKLGAPVSAEHLISMKETYQINLNSYTSRVDELVSLMKHDKKNKDASIRLVLLEDIGKPYLRSVKEDSLLREAWEYTLGKLT
ncbi:3-dehydroquinate synthase [Balneolaceae bacterium ANBcel3]|nr:3-dehydroquinate synthase [Balneolaceae bacterium ANBcel3]